MVRTLDQSTKTLKENMGSIPQLPGVYLMKNARGEILYVGKANNLRSRVQSYFSKESDSRYQVRFLMNKVEAIETVVTHNPKEALLLENTLIKKHRPRYNLQLKDDKSYVSLKLSIRDPAPRLYVTRRIKKDGSLYFGPYTSALGCREVVEFIQTHFRLRTCNDHDYRNRVRPCLQYQIKRCDAPCVGLISLEDYAELIQQVRLFLEGRNDELKKLAAQRMKQASREECFEEAARYRDLMLDMEKVLERQQVVSHRQLSRDVVGFYREGPLLAIYLMVVREGHLQETYPFFLKSYAEDPEVLSSFLSQYYVAGRPTPKELLLPFVLEDGPALQEVLTDRAGHSVLLSCPQRGEKASLLRLARQNAIQALAAHTRQEKNQRQVLKEVQEALHLKNIPHRLECYDISNFQGKDAMGSMVTFLEGKPVPSLYRHFKIKTVRGPDDFASLYEVLCRRLRRVGSKGSQEFEGPWSLPDLVVIDGGKGQLNAAVQAFREAGVEGVDLLSLAKSRLQAATGPEQSLGSRQRSEERVFLPGRKNPLNLPAKSSALFLLMQARDEAHRFGIESHRKLLKRRTLYSGLDRIEGVGKVRREKLLKTFGSLKGIKGAQVREIRRAVGGSEELARRIKESL